MEIKEGSKPSPSKKRRISFRRLQDTLKISKYKRVCIGEVLRRARVCPPQVTVRAGSVDEVSLNCIVTDYNHGRTEGGLHVAVGKSSFVNIADATGAFAVGMFGHSTGLDKLGLSENERGENSFLYFLAHLEGNISWRPGIEDNTQAIYFFTGSIIRSSLSVLDALKNGYLPTTDVLFQIWQLKFAHSKKNITSAIVGRIDVINMTDDKIAFTVEDAVGYAIVDIQMLDNLANFVQIHKIERGRYIYLEGDIRIVGVEEEEGDDENDEMAAVRLEIDGTKSTVKGARDSEKIYKQYFAHLQKLSTSQNIVFSGVLPHDLGELEKEE